MDSTIKHEKIAIWVITVWSQMQCWQQSLGAVSTSYLVLIYCLLLQIFLNSQ